MKINFTAWFPLVFSFLFLSNMAFGQCDLQPSLISTTDALDICAGDGKDDFVDVRIDENENKGRWVITDDAGNILGLPKASPFNFEGAGGGACNIYYMSTEGLVSVAPGMNIADITGCHVLSNAITVNRSGVDGGKISTTGSRYICAGDGEADMVDASVDGAIGENGAWVITDESGVILGLPPSPPFDFDGAGSGTCLIWHLSSNGPLTGVSVGANANNIQGCYDLSNSVKVVRRGVDAGTISTDDETTFVVGDGTPDLVTPTVSDWTGDYRVWIVTDSDGNMLAFPKKFPINFDGAGLGVCQIWHVTYTFGLKGIGVGNNIFDLQGCHDLSNPISVNRTDGTSLNGGSISTNDATTICAGDGVADPIDVDLSGAFGDNTGWIITDDQNNILALPPGPPFDLDGAGFGVCLIWHASWDDGLQGLVAGNNVSDLVGNFDLSNSIAVTRTSANGGMISALTGSMINRTVIANRASGNISVINNNDNTVSGTYDMPDGGEPMYAVYNSIDNTVWVGDYNGKVVGFDGADFSVKGSADAADGVFHMWLSPDGQQLWVNNELDKSVSVIDPITMQNITTFSIPQDLLDGGFKPHDVIVMPDNSAAFVTLIGPGDDDYVVKYSATTFEEMDRVTVGNDPHVSLTGMNDKLYVASQESSELAIFNRMDMSLFDVVNVPNAHGLGMSPNGQYLYIGNISEGGTNATYTLNTMTNELMGDPVDAPFSAPHNYAVSSDNNTLYLTHSGAANNQVSVYNLTPTPTLLTSIEVGNNPFGLVSYSYAEKTDMLSICAGDGESDAFDVTLSGNSGPNNGWVITDANGNILGLPAAPPFDLEGAGAGSCLVWHISYADGLEGLAMGNNTADLAGCYALSNPITVDRTSPSPDLSGGTISTMSETTTCAGDGSPDFIFVDLEGASGPGSQWVITDESLNILALPDNPPFNFEGAGAGVCLIWHIGHENNLTGAAVGANVSDVKGCFELSNSISVTRQGVDGGALSLSNGATEQTICAGDGVGDPLDVQVADAVGTSTSWVITNESFEILGVPPGPPFDLDGAGEGVCLIWHIAHNGPITGLELGLNALELDGCLSLSNAITVTRIATPDSLAGGMITTEDPTTICAGDGVGDPINVTLINAIGANSGWIITDSEGNILGLPAGPPFDLDGAGTGVCLIWHISYSDGLRGATVGANAADLQGCYELSNAITVTRNGVNGGALALLDGATDTVICAGDGLPNPLDVVVSGSEGTNAQWIITDQAGVILGLPPGPPFDLEGAGAGTCLIWYARFEGALTGVEVDSNAMNIEGCFDLSNPIVVSRVEQGGPCGQIAFSDELIQTRSSEKMMTVFPNPVTEQLNMRLDINIAKDFNISIFNANGQLVQTYDRTQVSAGETMNFDVSRIGDGYYIIRVSAEDVVRTASFIKN